jgi:hypothetical protein
VTTEGSRKDSEVGGSVCLDNVWPRGAEPSLRIALNSLGGACVCDTHNRDLKEIEYVPVALTPSPNDLAWLGQR